jgi:hypothetical protein
MTIDGRMMTRIYAAVSLVNRQNDGIDVLHVDKLDRYGKKDKNKIERPKKIYIISSRKGLLCGIKPKRNHAENCYPEGLV